MSPSHSLMRLSKELNIPQRCLEAVSQKQFTVHYFRGFTGIGCCPVNSSLWQLHCNCCDDLILAGSPHTNDLCHCPECDLQACSACVRNERCFICRCYESDEGNAFEPSCLREELLFEAYERSMRARRLYDFLSKHHAAHYCSGCCYKSD